ncbi:MAG: ATP-binding protein [Clostridiales bacterium]|nr:ATP-binding protein [Clostridiales bacterium]
MGYSRDVYDAAEAELARRREAARNRAAALRDKVISRSPRAREIEQEMAYSAISVARAVLDGGDVEAAVDTIKNKNLALQAELASLIAGQGEDAPNFEPRYTCPLCEDTGYTHGRMCSCLSALLREEACRRLSGMSPMKLTDFDSLRLDYYPEAYDPRFGASPREKMAAIFRYCRDYAEAFRSGGADGSPSLLLTGPTGIGKTHVSLAVAHRVVDKGFGVVYGPVQNLLHRMEKEHFGRAEGNTEELLTGCDLLILDDFGTEFLSPFYISCLYTVINTRMLEERPTLISTNLGREDMLDRYGEQITSRIIGTYTPLAFCGQDIRQLKLRERIGG